MAEIPGDGRTHVEPSTQAIRAKMARTRGELRCKLDMLKTHVLGDALRDALDPHARLRIRN